MWELVTLDCVQVTLTNKQQNNIADLCAVRC